MLSKLFILYTLFLASSFVYVASQNVTSSLDLTLNSSFPANASSVINASSVVVNASSVVVNASSVVVNASSVVANASSVVANASSGAVNASSGAVAASSGAVAASSGAVAASSGAVAASSGAVAASSGAVAASSGAVAASSPAAASSSGPPHQHQASHNHNLPRKLEPHQDQKHLPFQLLQQEPFPQFAVTLSLKSVRNAIQELETLADLHAVTQKLVYSRELTKNADLPQENATNSLDAVEPQHHDSVDQLHSEDQMPDALSQEPPRGNVTEAEFANKDLLIPAEMRESDASFDDSFLPFFLVSPFS